MVMSFAFLWVNTFLTKETLDWLLQQGSGAEFLNWFKINPEKWRDEGRLCTTYL